MAYLANAFAPQRAGLAAVWYNSGVERGLSAITYDRGGSVGVLLGQDEGSDLPPDVGVDPNIPTGPLPIDMQPVSPVFTMPFIPSPTVDTTSTPVAGGLVPPAQQPADISNAMLTDILNAAKTIVPLATGASTGQAKPQTAGTVVTTGPGASTAGLTASLTQELPTIGIVAGVALVGLVLISSFSGGGGSRRSRRRNPAELILMGANPSYCRRRR